ncbi:MAG: acyl-ACP--UDP-N-acetylglucosamine O-acyltransferase [Kiritimatiellae bacterium]|nr:acyl-ACP--UDP-N-acetylglucosamine O-acyltransferase [Kiritimatiellia bacterium]
MTNIHPTAIVDPGAQLGADVTIGPYCVVGPNVVLGDRCVLKAQCHVDGHTTLGPGCEVWPFASVGGKTQDLKYKGGAPRLVVGAATVIRECATLNCATADGNETRVGSHCLLMACSHVGHDSIVGDRVIIANGSLLAGHVLIEDDVILGGMSGVHQFVRIGTMAILGGCTKAVKDVPPYMMADGDPLKVVGPNTVGLTRHNISAEAQQALRQAYRILYRTPLLLKDALAQIESTLPPLPEILHLLSFIRASTRSLSR